MIGLYVAGSSVLHRMRAGSKLLLLLVLAIVVLALRTPVTIGIAALSTFGVFAIVRIPWRTALSQLRPVLLFLLPLFALQCWLAGPARATVVVGQLVVMIALAVLVTLTTKVSAMLEAFEVALRPLRRLGVDPGRIALVLALTVRCVPLVGQAYAETRQAQRARGLEHSVLALAVPLVIRLLKKADHIGEALAARGVDD